MQRVSALLPSWDRPKSIIHNNTAAKVPGALDKVRGWAEKIAVPVGSRMSVATNGTTSAAPARFGRETYWPTTLDKECDKAARILKSFCFDGFLAQDAQRASITETPSTPTYVTKKIPQRILQNAVGLAVFSCMRSGLWMSGSGGAGLITARKADGTWSPPSGIILHTAALAFVIGVDIYDCVLVINSVQVLEVFTRPKATLGADVSLTVGPLVSTTEGAALEEIRWKELENTVLTYVKARGKHQAVELDGSLVMERGNENERFYAESVSVMDILAGNISKSVPEMGPLFEVIKAAEGRSDFDKTLMNWLAQQPAPSDAVIETPTPSPSSASNAKKPFGIPSADDPDPFGVIGLEMAGIEIREAGTRLRPVSTQFEYNPSPTSPIFAKFNRQSVDTYVSRSNRGSYMSTKTQATAMTDACTQTDVGSTVDTTLSRANSEDGRDSSSTKLPPVMEPEEIDYTQIDTSIIDQLRTQRIEETIEESPEETSEMATESVSAPPTVTAVPEDRAETTDQAVGTDDADADADANLDANDDAKAGSASSTYPADERDEDADDEEEEEEEEEDEPVILEVATAAQPTRTSIRTSQVTPVIQVKGALVTIPKRIPPPLPPRSPARVSRASKSDYGDVSSLRSPLRNSFQSSNSATLQVDGAQPTEVDAAVETPEAAEETFMTPADIVETDPIADIEVAEESPESYKADFQKHQKNSSSVYTAVPISMPISRTPEQRQQQWTIDDSSSPVPPAPQTVELMSSAEDSEREPRTPKTDIEFMSAEENSKTPSEVTKAVNIVSHNGNAESNPVTVA